MKVCTVKLKGGSPMIFRNATGAEDGFSVTVYGAEDKVLGRFGLPDVSSWWNGESPPEEGEGVDMDFL